MHRALIAMVLICGTSRAFAQPTTAPVGRFPHIDVDVQHKQVRVECQALHCEAPLEFFCVVNGTNEHESVLRTPAKPSQIHTALLMLGLEPGEPVHFDPAAKKWIPPHGPGLQISVEFDKDGKHYAMPAYELMRDLNTKKTMPKMNWIFAGSRVMPDGVYAADATGYVVSIVNFDLTLIDIPDLASSANETLEWEARLDQLPPLGSKVTMIIEPAPAKATTQPAHP
jgi:hypothetical protein